MFIQTKCQLVVHFLKEEFQLVNMWICKQKRASMSRCACKYFTMAHKKKLKKVCKQINVEVAEVFVNESILWDDATRRSSYNVYARYIEKVERNHTAIEWIDSLLAINNLVSTWQTKCLLTNINPIGTHYFT